MNQQYQDVFLSRKELLRLHLLRRIVKIRHQIATAVVSEPHGVNLREVAASLNRSYSSVYHTYSLLLADLRRLASADATPEALLAIPEETLRLMLVQESVAYRFLNHLLLGDITDFTTFLATVPVSRVTVLSRLRPLRAVAKSFSVRIVYEGMQLLGEEANIRAFFTFAFGIATRAKAWPFATCARPDALALVRRLEAQTDSDDDNPVTVEAYAYLAAVSLVRIDEGHVHRQMPTLIVDPIANVFGGYRGLSAAVLRCESQYLYLISSLAPVYIAPNDPKVVATLLNFKHFDPQVRAFVKRVVQALPPELVGGAFGDAMRNLVEASLLVIVASVLALGFDLSTTVAYCLNPELQNAQPNQHLDDQITAAFNVAATQEADSHRLVKRLPLMIRAAYRNLLQLQRFTRPLHQVRVGLLLGPVALEYIDLLTFVAQQPAVRLVDAKRDQCDLLIVSSALPVSKQEKTPKVFRWRASDSKSLFGELFTTIQEMQRDV